MNNQLLKWILVIVWMVLIFIGSSIPAEEFPDAPKQISILVHFVEFFVLTLLLLNALNLGIRNKIKFISLVTALLVAVFYGFTDEFHQMYVPGRVPDLIDIALDMAGALVACGVYFVLSLRLSLKKKDEKE